MSENENTQKGYENQISVRVDQHTFRRIMAIAYKYGDGQMSSIVRMCIDTALDDVESYLKSVEELKKEKLKITRVPRAN